MNKTYFEAHVTFLTGYSAPGVLKEAIENAGWKFSSISGDANLGEGVKQYATRQFNVKIGEHKAITHVRDMATVLENLGADVLRRKVERVIYDDRSALVKPCNGGCVECHLDDIAPEGFSESSNQVYAARASIRGQLVVSREAVVNTPSRMTPDHVTLNGEEYVRIGALSEGAQSQEHTTTQAFKHIISAMARAGLGIAEVDGDLVIKIARTDMLEARREDLVNKVMEGISDIMLDASVDFPAGRGAGHRIEYDEDAMRKLIDHAI